jgi:hypothetical protein
MLGAAVAAGLRRAGYSVASADDLNRGDTFRDELVTAWNAADAFVIVLSRLYLKSRFRLIELGAALGAAHDGTPVIVVRQGKERLPTGNRSVRMLDVGGKTPEQIADTIKQALDHTPAAASA